MEGKFQSDFEISIADLGSATGGATITAPSAGFADAILASLIQKRVPDQTSRSSNSSSSSSTDDSSLNKSDDKSSHTSTGTIVGAVIGGVAGLGLIICIIWYLLARRAKQSAADAETPGDSRDRRGQLLLSQEYTEMDGNNKIMAEMQGDSRRVAEMQGNYRQVAEMQGEHKGYAELG